MDNSELEIQKLKFEKDKLQANRDAYQRFYKQCMIDKMRIENKYDQSKVDQKEILIVLADKVLQLQKQSRPIKSDMETQTTLLSNPDRFELIVQDTLID